MEGFFTAMLDEFPSLVRGKKYGREFFVLGICIISYLCGLSTVTEVSLLKKFGKFCISKAEIYG